MGFLGGVGAQQIVGGVPAGNVLGDQVRADKFAQQAASRRFSYCGEAGGGGDADVGAGMQAQQPEQLRRRGAELLVGPGEHRPHT